MKKEYLPLRYDNFIKRIVAIVLIIWIIPFVYCMTRENGVPFNWNFIVLPLILSIVIPLILYVLRKVFLGNLAAFEVDFHTLYDLEKRKKKNSIYNLNLLINLHFFDGDFQKAIDCSDEIMRLSSKQKDIYSARHQKILSLFFSNKTENIVELIHLQRLIKPDSNAYYIFIENYLDANYEVAIKSIKKILEEQNIEIQNHRKILVYYLMRMCFLKIGDSEQVENCTNQILKADRNHHTFFTKQSEQSGDGSMC